MRGELPHARPIKFYEAYCATIFEDEAFLAQVYGLNVFVKFYIYCSVFFARWYLQILMWVLLT